MITDWDTIFSKWLKFGLLTFSKKDLFARWIILIRQLQLFQLTAPADVDCDDEPVQFHRFSRSPNRHGSHSPRPGSRSPLPPEKLCRRRLEGSYPKHRSSHSELQLKQKIQVSTPFISWTFPISCTFSELYFINCTRQFHSKMHSKEPDWTWRLHSCNFISSPNHISMVIALKYEYQSTRMNTKVRMISVDIRWNLRNWEFWAVIVYLFHDEQQLSS